MSRSLDIAGACDRVGHRLRAEYGTEPIPGAVLIAEVVKECGCQPGSVIPTDRCYNRTNNGIQLQNNPIFIYEGPSLFRYVGLNYPFTGPLLHKPKDNSQPERIVGQWVNGHLQYTG